MLAVEFAALMFIVLLDMSAAQPATDVSRFFGEESYVAAFGRNVVNVILVDFRGFDTLGETTVIALSAIIAWSLLGPRNPHEERAAIPPGRAAFILTFTTPAFFWMLLAMSVVILFRGHNDIGGGFVGGLTAALAFAIVSLAKGVDRARARLRLHPLASPWRLLRRFVGVPGLLVKGLSQPRLIDTTVPVEISRDPRSVRLRGLPLPCSARSHPLRLRRGARCDCTHASYAVFSAAASIWFPAPSCGYGRVVATAPSVNLVLFVRATPIHSAPLIPEAPNILCVGESVPQPLLLRSNRLRSHSDLLHCSACYRGTAHQECETSRLSSRHPYERRPSDVLRSP